MFTVDISGTYKVTTDDGMVYEAQLPGTLDENRIGHRDSCSSQWHPDAAPVAEPDTEPDYEPAAATKNSTPNSAITCNGSANTVITSRFTRNYTFEGKAFFSRKFTGADLIDLDHQGRRIFLEIERARKLSVSLNGSDLLPFEDGTLSTPYIFEVTGLIRDENELVFNSDNSYEGWPREAILYSSAATDETQTNWNGLLGYIRLRVERGSFISRIRVYPRHGRIDVAIEIHAAASGSETLHIKSAALNNTWDKDVALQEGLQTILLEGLPLSETAQLWDEYEGTMYPLQVYGNLLEPVTVQFGIRKFGSPGDRYLTLNNHRIFLRGETNCCVFPENGHMPMDTDSWMKIFDIYKSYGVNCVRFHSHCPPEAAFLAADEAGMLVQPELSNWDPRTAFESDESIAYYQRELECILKTYANHPSFVMLTLGNELHCSAAGIDRMNSLLRLAKEIDSTRMYAIASNAFYGERGTDPESGFYTSAALFKDMLRGTSSGMTGHLNNQYPSASTDYDSVLAKLRKDYHKPVFAFEAGQYEILPDFDEIDDFKGVTAAENIRIIKRYVEEAGFLPDWKMRAAASGELSLICYREEIEAVMRTREMSGISLLGLQDFPGQGTALVGMLNSHLQSKPFAFAEPERFRRFFTAVLPLVFLEKYTYTEGETLHAAVSLANYGSKDVHGIFSCQLSDKDTIYQAKSAGPVDCPHSMLTNIGVIDIPLVNTGSAKKLTLTVQIGPYVNQYSIWVYPDIEVVVPEDISIVSCLSDAMIELDKGRKVFLSPEAAEENFINSIKTRFTTDFWSVGTFPFQEGYMGCMVDPEHAIFHEFPTDFHADWQWWPLTHARAMLLPNNMTSHITALDCYAKLRNLSFLTSCRTGSGRLMISSMGLLQKQQYPEARALLRSIVSYMESDSFEPEQMIREDVLASIVR